jgi:hypothetical protein
MIGEAKDALFVDEGTGGKGRRSAKKVWTGWAANDFHWQGANEAESSL